MRVGGNTHRIAIMAGVAVMLAAGAAVAIPPPYVERVKHLGEILESREVRDRLKDHPIDSIELVRANVFRVRGGTCQLEVRFVAEPQKPGMTGSPDYNLVVGNATCR
jgi:hypothetical protein